MGDTPTDRTLRRAVAISGGEAQLAATMNVTPEELRSWLAAESVPPTKAYLVALDIVARGFSPPR
jgi:DNA-binding transcriptional regulator YiaG